jgi:hypothetical protein
VPALRPCLGCGLLQRDGSRCRRCAKRRERAKRGSSGKQAKFRRRTLAITGGICARCGRAAEVAHHDPPVGEGGDPDKPGVPLCERCHRLAHAR